MSFESILKKVETVETKSEFLDLLNKVSDDYYNPIGISNSSSLSYA